MVLASLVGALIGFSAPLARAIEPNQIGIATYNSQGAKWADVRAIFEDGNDIVAVQEAGSEPSPYGITLQRTHIVNGFSIRHYRWNDRHVYWMNTDPRGNRVNLAMVTRSEATELFVATSGLIDARPALGLRFDNDIYYNVHARATSNNEALQLLTNIDAGSGAYEWTALGDFNRDPDDQIHTTATALGAHVYHSGETTQQSGGELDYMVSSRYMANFYGMRMNGRGSDHYPVYFRPRLVANGSVIDLVGDRDNEKYVGWEGRKSADGTHMVMDSYNPAGGQWTLRVASGGTGSDFTFVNNTTGKCIDTEGITSGSLLSEWPCLGQESQVFTLYRWKTEPGAWAIENKRTGLCVDVFGTQPRYLGLYKCTSNSPNQHFLPHFF